MIHLVMIHHFFFQQLEIEMLLALLRPFQQSALEIDFGLLKLLKVDVNVDDTVDDDVLGKLEASVKVDGTYQGFESIASQGTESIT